MKVISVHDKREIKRFLQGNIDLNIYSIGDLDDFFWPYTVWYGSGTANGLKSLVLVYTGSPPPTVLALADDLTAAADLLTAMGNLLPCRFYAHLSPGLEEALFP